MSQKPSLAKGTRDFLPEQSRKRKFIFQTIEQCFVHFGYQPLETPAMENLSTLMGKYGEEGDKLLFKILDSGDYLKDVPTEIWADPAAAKMLPYIAEKGLRYDLTVPLARTVVMNRHLLPFPFKRYQIQPVWRADRPQRGRYREFYQCDADVLGSDSLMYEAELIIIYLEVFKRLQIPVKVLYNHRAILEGMSVKMGREDLFLPMTAVLDKLDKVGEEAVINELVELGFDTKQVAEMLNALRDKTLASFEFNEKGRLGVNSLRTILDYIQSSISDLSDLVFEPGLARGLSYYTGTIFEVVPTSVKMGSLGGGGRYDNLTGVFGVEGISGVGLSFGADRIYDVMEELGLFPSEINNPVKLLLLVLDEASHRFAFQLANRLRGEGIKTDVYPEPGKLKKQFKYAEDIKAEYIAVIGEAERDKSEFSIKDQATGQQTNCDIESLIQRLKG